MAVLPTTQKPHAALERVEQGAPRIGASHTLYSPAAARFEAAVS